MALPHSGIPAADPAPQDATVDDLTAATLTVTGASTLAAVTATSVAAPHSGLTGVTADQHHAKSHIHDGIDGSGSVAHSSTTGRTANDHHAQSHAHDGADSSGTVAHSATTGRTANDHHNQAHVVTGADHTASGLTAGHVLRATGATTFAFGALADSDVPATIARDTEVTTAVSDHAALADPHTGYQLESEKGVANGYASLDASVLLPAAQLPAHQHGVPFFGPLSPAEINSTAVDLGVANRAMIWPFIAYKSQTVTTAKFRIVTTEAVNLDVGIYSAALSRLGSSGSTAVGASGSTASLSIGSVALVAGTLYYAAFAVGGTTAKFEGFVKSGSAWTTGNAFFQRQETALPLPATFVVAGTDDVARAVAIYFS